MTPFLPAPKRLGTTNLCASCAFGDAAPIGAVFCNHPLSLKVERAIRDALQASRGLARPAGARQDFYSSPTNPRLRCDTWLIDPDLAPEACP